MTAVCERKLDTENNISRDLRKTVDDGDGNVGKTIKLITQDKKCT